MDLINRLKTYRLKNKITQEALAKKLDVAFATVNRWFNGRSKPSEIQSYHIEKLLKEGAKNGKGKSQKYHFKKIT